MAAIRKTGKAAAVKKIKIVVDLDRMHRGEKLPPVSGKPLKKGEEDYGQMCIDKDKPHLSLLDLSKLVERLIKEARSRKKDIAEVKVWIEGSAYWGQAKGARFFDNDRMVLFEKRN